MRRALVVLAVLGVSLAPAAAHAQESGLRDPFDPLLTVETDTTTTTDGDTGDTTTTITDSDTDIVTDEDPGLTDGLPATGRDPRSWLAFAYVLLAAGTGILVFTRQGWGVAR